MLQLVNMLDLMLGYLMNGLHGERMKCIGLKDMDGALLDGVKRRGSRVGEVKG